MPERPELSLKDEIVNHFSHLADDTENQTQTLKHMASLVKSVIKEISTLEWARGQLEALKKVDSNNKEIPEIEKFLKDKEAELKARYYHEEIKGT
jgi:hypothetical protein